ncbi:MAG TPA: glycosyl hydrolase family 28 protein [Tepidisphaeraceae bacterium]|nr:glycosyl hydrolase family 28 protein [Tepidisphaeraceae bacterium]
MNWLHATVGVLAALLASCAPSAPPSQPRAAAIQLPWARANEIVARVQPPKFPDARFSVLDFGAVADGKTDNSDAFARAIAAASHAGGGHVIVPPGKYACGAIELLSNIDLHLDGATILFSSDSSKYPISITRYQGIDLMNRSPLIHAVDQTNVAITGNGILDGAATAKWNKDGKGNFNILQQMARDGVPIAQRLFGADRPLRTTFIEPYHCTSVLIQGVTIRNSRFWQMHPCLCTNVLVDGVTTQSTTSQTDGCDPESCQDVVIRDCLLGAGDDCIAIKAGRNPDSQRIHRPCSDIVVMDDRFHGPWGMITCGSEVTEGIEHVYGYHLSTVNNIEDVRHQTGAYMVLYLKTNTTRGGFIRDVHLDDITGKFNRDIVLATLAYSGDKPGRAKPDVSDISISHINNASAPLVLDMTGLENDPIADFALTDSSFVNVTRPDRVRDVNNLILKNVTVNGRQAN